MSLINQGHLPAQSNAPLLVINGAKDNLVKITEIDLLNSHCANTDIVVFSQDRHAASNNWNLHSQFSVNWLERKLNAKEKVIHGIVVFVLILPMSVLFPWLYHCPSPSPFVHKLDRQPPIFSSVLGFSKCY